MKKSFGMVVLACVAAVLTGCATVKEYGDGQALSGDVPKVGQIVRVVSLIGRETSGPYEYLMVWEPAEGNGEAKVMRMIGGHCFVDYKTGGSGDYLIQKDSETVIKFTKLER